MQGLEPVAPSGRRWQLAVLVAVSAIFALAYLDSRREEARALADFSAEQATLARTSRSRSPTADRMRPDIASEALFAEVVTSADAEAPTSSIVMDDSRRWTMRGPLASSWRFDSGATPNLEIALDRRGSVTSVNAYLAARGCKAHVDPDRVLPVSGHDERGPLWGLVREARLTRRLVERPGLPILLGGDRPRDIDAYAIPPPEVDCFLLQNDRTDLRVLEHNLRRAEKLATIGTLAAGVAHEVGTPLGIISGRAEQLLARLPEGEPTDVMRRRWARSSRRSTRCRPPSVSCSTSHAFGRWNGRAWRQRRCWRLPLRCSSITLGRAGVALRIDASPTAYTVAADPTQLEQVLVNLLMNACDACAAEGHVVARTIGRGTTVESWRSRPARRRACRQPSALSCTGCRLYRVCDPPAHPGNAARPAAP